MNKQSKIYTDQEIKNIKMYNALPRIFPHELNQGCPICGDYEGDANDCPNGCHDNNEMALQDLSDLADACEEQDTHEQIMARPNKPQYLIDDDDEYQDQLELMWYKEEHS